MSEAEFEYSHTLSPLQRGMLFHSLQSTTADPYIVGFSCDLYGAISINDFQNAWQIVTQRYPALRSCFDWHNTPEPQQIINRHALIKIEQQDCRALSAKQQRDNEQTYSACQMESGFDLQRAPLMRLMLLRTGERSYRFIWHHHHLILDGWSIAVVLANVAQTYSSSVNGLVEQCATLSVPYQQTIHWLQQHWRQDNTALWQNELKGYREPLCLAGGKRKPDHSASGVNEQRITLSAEHTMDLQEFCRRERITSNTLMQGIWALFLSHYSGRRDIVFGTVCSGRSPEMPGFDTMVGLFINTLPTRVLIEHDRLVTDWLRDLQTHQMGLLESQYTGLTSIQECSELPPGTPLFESIVVLENYPSDQQLQTYLDNFTIRNTEWVSGTSYPLCLMIVPGPEQVLALQYDEAYYSQEVVKQILAHVQTLFQNLVDKPKDLVKSIDVLSASQRQQQIETWNNTDANHIEPETLHGLFEQQCILTPDAIAVCDKNSSLSYAKLNKQSIHLAAHLRQQGLASGDIVGLYLDRSALTLISILGVLKAGAAFLPLDVGQPVKRSSSILLDSKASLMLTSTAYKEAAISVATCVELVEVEQALNNVNCLTAALSNPEITTDSTAYVIYTSGSTGTPKGVVISHRAISNYLRWGVEFYDMPQVKNALVHSSLASDLTFTALFAPLLVGGVVYFLPQDSTLESIYEYLVNEPHIGLLKLTPSHLTILNGLAELRQKLLSAKTLVLGGESLGSDHCDHWFQHSPETILVNEYGPTETVVGCCAQRISREHGEFGPMPIGKPIANMKLYILDEQLRLLPVGATGNLFIGGSGIADGYLYSPELTEQRFVPNPFYSADTDPHWTARLFNTGDLARYKSNGVIEYLGRADRQIQIRGFRVEPAEIEATLQHHDWVKECAVIEQASEQGSALLVACIVLHATADTVKQDISESFTVFLRDYLPAAMIPSHFQLFDRLPLTSSGKIDYNDLEQSIAQVPVSQVHFRAPQTQSEKCMATIWEKVLNQKQVGLDDNFFALGGHSLSAMQVAVQIKSTFGRNVLISDLLVASTLQATAKLCEPLPDNIEDFEQKQIEAILDELDSYSELDAQRLLAESYAEGEGN